MADEQIDKEGMTTREVFPGGTFRRPDPFVKSFLRLPPGANNLDVRPMRSMASAHGYLILSAPEYWDLLDEMYESDEVLRMCLDLMVAYMLMRPQGVRVETGEDDPRAGQIQEFFEDRFVNNPRVNFRYLCWSLALGILKHGRSTNEILWEFTGDGALLPKQFYHCHPGQFAFNREGEMFLQKDLASATPLPSRKFVTAVNASLYDNPWGDSALFPFRYKWQYKKRVLIAKLQYLERFGTPIVHGQIPKETTEKEQAMAELIAAIEQLDSGMALVTALGEEIKVHQRSTSGLGGSDGVHDAIIDRIDSYFIRALLGAELNTTAGDRGARSLGEVHERTVLNKILPLARIVEKALNLLVFDPIRILNFGEGSPVVRYWFDTEESTDAEDARETLKSAVDNGVPVTVRQAQNMLGIEPAGPDDELLKKPQTVVAVPGMPSASDTETGEDTERGNIIPMPDEDELEDDELAASEFGKETQAAIKTFQNKETKFAQYSFGSTQLDVGEWGRMILKAWLDNVIADEDLYTDANEPDKYGREYDSHVTVLYGLKPDVTLEQVESAVAGEWWQWLEFGEMKVFSKDDKDFDVLVIDVRLSEELKQLRAALETLPFETDHPIYEPHLTLAYLKKGTWQKYLNNPDVDNPLEGWMEVVEKLTFSTVDDVRHDIWLTGPYVEMDSAIDSARATMFKFATQMKLPVEMSTLWHRADSAGEKFRELKGEINRSAETQGHEWSEKIAEVAVADTHSQLVDVLKATSERLGKYDKSKSLNLTLVSDVDMRPMKLEETARRIVLSTFMIRQWIAANELEGVREVQPKYRAEYEARFADEDDELLDLMPEGFRDAAEWMASRGVMTVEKVRELAQIMAEQFGGSAKQWEVNLRDEYLVLAKTAETGATKKIQGLIEQAVRNGETLADFLNGLDGLIELGDVPPGLESYWETVFRTEVGNAYKKAQIANEMDPDFEPYHWGWEGYNPVDDRSDPTHSAINGKKFKKGSAASTMLGLPPFRYNCRCAMFALTSPDPNKPGHRESKSALSIASKVHKF